MDIKPYPAIYKLINLDNNKFYVGGTRNAQARKRHHFYDFRKGRHRNPKLQRDYNLGHTFKFMILEYLDVDMTDDFIVRREQEWQDFLQPEYNSRNAIKVFGSDLELQRERKLAGRITTHTQSQAEKDKRAQSVKEYWKTHPPKVMPSEWVEQLKKRMKGTGHPNYGKSTPQEVKNKISTALCKYIYYFLSPEGEVIPIQNLRKYVEDNKMWGFYDLKAGTIDSYRGWTFIRRETAPRP